MPKKTKDKETTDRKVEVRMTELSFVQLEGMKGGGDFRIPTNAGSTTRAVKEQAIQDLEAVKDGIKDY